jgi:hypothetical protein
MSDLRQDEGFAGQADDFYARLLAAYRGLSDAEGHALNARLVLLLANHIGDLHVIDAALSAARSSLESATSATGGNE